MDLSSYSIEELILAAMKSEIDARDFYVKVSEGVKNALLKDRLAFLSGEEEKHKVFFEQLYRKRFQGEEIVLPEKSPVPLPQLKVEDESMPMSEVLTMAMNAEEAACEFYTLLADRYQENPEVRSTLLYFASMEMGHYRLLELERENARKFEDVDFEWPMMHVGP
jgi:rubrerythrin